MSWSKIKPYLLGVAVPLAVGGLSTLLSGGGDGFYDTVTQPSFSPPPYIFPVVWAILYILMGISATTVILRYKQDARAARDGLVFGAISLYMNFFYSILFFRFRLFLLSFFWLYLLLVFIILTILHYRRISRFAARAQIPYAVWVSFAGLLTLMIWYLNR